jgi:hypothetical protein
LKLGLHVTDTWKCSFYPKTTMCLHYKGQPMFKKIISDTQGLRIKKSINAFYRKNRELLNFKARGTNRYHWALKII